MKELQLSQVELPRKYDGFRKTVRQFLREQIKQGTFKSNCDSWLNGYSTTFSKKLGEQGWIGMTWPKEYGGNERSQLERYILIEELLVAGAPIAAHWFSDRQTGPLLLKYGTEAQKKYFLPQMATGECFFAIGLSEPNSGSDLASIQSFATKTTDGWILNGSKTWTSGAHYADYIVVLCRTSPLDKQQRHAGFSQFIVDLKSEGVSIRPIKYLTGEHHFNEVFFDNVFIPKNHLVGSQGEGWQQSMAELAFERSGPERILSTFPLFHELIEWLKEHKDQRGLAKASRLFAEMYNLRLMSIGVAQKLEAGEDVNIHAALVKDLGTAFEKKIAELARLVIDIEPTIPSDRAINRLYAQAILHAPGFTLRGGTTEILRGIIAKGLV